MKNKNSSRNDGANKKSEPQRYTRLRKLIKETLEIDEIDDQFKLEREDIDSFKKLMLLSNIEKEYGINITIDEALKVNTINDFVLLLNTKDVEENEI